MTKIEEIELAYAAMWRKLGLEPAADLNCEVEEPMRVYLRVEFKHGKYRLLPTENGAALDLKETTDKDQLLEWLGLEIATRVGSREAIEMDPAGKGGRKAWLRQQISVLHRLNGAWANRRAEEMKSVLEE